MKLLVNGDRRDVADGATVADLLNEMETPPSGVAVAVNGEVVPRVRWGRLPLTEGDRVEVLSAIGGG
ncbi:MAG: sulfur carrier protein ThiS [Actinomycetota bacterium]